MKVFNAVLGKREHLFLLSHMRSYSTVLSHILGSHPDICGHIEHHRSYRRRWDLLKLRYRNFISERRIPNKYYLDKVLHNNIRFSNRVMAMRNVRFLVFIREPAATFDSLIRFSNSRRPDYGKPSWILDYYTKRLERLADECARTKAPMMFFDSRDVVQNTGPLLDQLAKWLGLTEKLSCNYQLFSNTGTPGLGDSSPQIRAGKILSVSTELPKNDGFRADMLARAQEHYQKYREYFIKRCHTFSDIRAADSIPGAATSIFAH